MKQLVKRAQRILRSAYIRFLFCAGLLKWAKSRVAKSGAVVLTLHRVLTDSEYEVADSQRGMLVRAGSFESLLQYLQKHCSLVSLDSPLAADKREDSKPRVAVTFDDGWKDNFQTAFPIARKFGLPFTVFICPELIGGNGPFWTEVVCSLWGAARRAGKLHIMRALSGGMMNGSVDSLIERLKQASESDRETFITEVKAALVRYNFKPHTSDLGELLDWDDVKEMSEAGVQFGSHTNTHQILTQIPQTEALQELTQSKHAIEAQLRSCSWLAYPNGDWSEQVRQLASDSGYHRAFSNSPGVWKQNTDPFCIPRINIWEGKLVGNNGRFSRVAVEYAVFWAAWRASRS